MANYTSDNEQKKPIIEMQSNTIEQVFNERAFGHFRKYCVANDIKHMTSLHEFDFNKLYSLRSFGEVKVNAIKTRAQEYFNSNIIIKRAEGAKKEEIEVVVHPSSCAFNLDCLSILGVGRGTIGWLKGNNFEKLGDLQKLKFSELRQVPLAEQKKKNMLEKKLKLLKEPVDFDMLFSEAWSQLRQRDSRKILLKRAQGYTLQKIGEEQNLSRERIRQISKKAINSIKVPINIFSGYIISKSEGKPFLDFNDLEALFDNQEDALLLKYVLMNKAIKWLSYFEELEIFLIDRDANEDKKKLKEIISNKLPDFFALGESSTMLAELLAQSQLKYIDIDMFKKYLFAVGYYQYKGYICKGKMSLIQIYNLILKEYFPQGIDVYEAQQIQQVRHIMKQEFGYLELPTDRAITARIVNTAVLCGKGKYIAPEYIKIQSPLLEEIKEYILSGPEDSIIIAEIFYKYEERLKQHSNITNKYFLHGVLRYYYEDLFTFTRDIITKRGETPKPSYLILEQYLDECRAPVNKQEIKKLYPGFTDVMLSNATMLNPKILYLGNSCFAHANILDITAEDKSALGALLEEIFASLDGYANAYIVHRHLRTNGRDFLLRNQIKSSDSLFYILEHLFGKEFYFSNPHILLDKPDGRFSTSDLLRNFMAEKDCVSFSELKKYALRLQLKEITVSTAMTRLKEELVQLSPDEIILKNNFVLPDGALEVIDKQLEVRIEDKGYFALNSITDNYYIFPLLEYRWTPHLLKAIIQHYLKNFKIVEKEAMDRRRITGAVVKQDSPISNYTDLIAHVLCHNYPQSRFFTIKDIEDYLKQEGIIIKKIPQELLSCGIITVDDHGKVFLKA